MRRIPRMNYRCTGNLSDILLPFVRPREGICSRIALITWTYCLYKISLGARVHILIVLALDMEHLNTRITHIYGINREYNST